MPLHQTEETSHSHARRRLRIASDPTTPAAPEPAAVLALDEVLEQLERRPLPVSEFRILLAVRGGDTPVSELAETFDRHPVDIRRAAARLFARGLLHWRDDPVTKEAVFRATRAGQATLQPLLDAAGTSDTPTARSSQAA